MGGPLPLDFPLWIPLPGRHPARHYSARVHHHRDARPRTPPQLCDALDFDWPCRLVPVAILPVLAGGRWTRVHGPFPAFSFHRGALLRLGLPCVRSLFHSLGNATGPSGADFAGSVLSHSGLKSDCDEVASGIRAFFPRKRKAHFARVKIWPLAAGPLCDWGVPTVRIINPK